MMEIWQTGRKHEAEEEPTRDAAWRSYSMGVYEVCHANDGSQYEELLSNHCAALIRAS